MECLVRSRASEPNAPIQTSVPIITMVELEPSLNLDVFQASLMDASSSDHSPGDGRSE